MVEIDGIDIEDHKRLYPERWTVKARAWPEFWWSFSIIPMMAAAHLILGEAWDKADTSFAFAWIGSAFFIALKPVPKGLKTYWYLDRKTWWTRMKERHLTNN